jgi:hypothetical protein
MATIWVLTKEEIIKIILDKTNTKQPKPINKDLILRKIGTQRTVLANQSTFLAFCELQCIF